MANRDQYRCIRAFSNHGTIFLNKNLQDVYVDVREKTEFSRNDPGFENCLRPVSRIEIRVPLKTQAIRRSYRSHLRELIGYGLKATVLNPSA